MRNYNNIILLLLLRTQHRRLTTLLLLCFQFYFSNCSFGQILSANAGNNLTICQYDTITLGGTPTATGGVAPYTFSWQPVFGLSSSTSSNPKAFPTGPTSYTLMVTDSIGTIATDVISISHLPLPNVSAGPDQTIMGGSNTSLLATGGVNYFWSPASSLQNQNTATPTAEPISTTTYCVAGVDSNGCINFDCMVLTIIPSDTVIIYNAFTPNGDGVNDELFIGNLAKFPDNKIQIFNRNGKLVFQESQYKNDWTGKIDGADLPCATYYIILDLGPGYKKVNGAVTIIR